MSRPSAVASEANRADPRSWRERNRTVIDLGLAWLRSLLEAQIVALRASAPPESFAGGTPVMSDLKADWLLRRPGVGPPARSPAAVAARAAYEAARGAMRDDGEAAAIDRLAERFNLTPFDEDLLLLALAPRVDPSFGALFGYVHDRLSLAKATPYLGVTLLARGPAEDAARERLAPDAPLRRFALLVVEGGEVEALAPLALDERLAGYLMGEDHLDPRIRPYLRPASPAACPERHRGAVETLGGRLAEGGRSAALLIGPRRSGRRAAAQSLAARFGLGLVELDPSALPGDAEARRARLPLLAREAALAGFAYLIDLAPEGRTSGEEQQRLARVAGEDALLALDAFVVLLAEHPVELPLPVASLRLAPLEAADRAALWSWALGPAATELADGAVDRLAEQFALGPGEIDAIARGLDRADAQSLWVACREAAGRSLDDLAERIEPRFGWDDIVLPEPVRRDLEAIAAQVRHRAEVYRRWGFGRKLVRGRGVSALFAGPSGVGKTMAAEVIARDLGLDLWRIDLSGVVSKYIGETEKNLRRVFDAAEGSGAVLFFDEADALFGKRSEVRDSHDRYANIEVSYLLQRMESYTGLAILATNLKTHLDAAFLRRLRYVVDFPFPDSALRRSLWARTIPPEAPLESLDLDALAELEIAGGNITVIAVNAAFLAAAESKPIGMAHVARAARAEFRKLDKQFRPIWPGS